MKINNKLSPDVARFLHYVKADCKKNGIKFFFSNKRYVITGRTKCNGFFDDVEKVLAVAGGQPLAKWLRILTHEYAHMTQWKDNTKIWNACKNEGYEAERFLEAWVDHEIELTKKQLVNFTTRARNVEWECEKRTIQLIKRFNLPLDTDLYAKTANAYVYFWTYQMYSRRWYTIGQEPYNTDSIVDVMPTHLNLNHGKMPLKLRKLYRKELGF